MIFRQKLATEDESIVWREAREYITELSNRREENIKGRGRAENLLLEVKDIVEEINEDNDTIRAIQKSRSFKFKARIFLKTLGPMIGDLFRFVRRHPRVFGSLALTSLGGVISFIASLYSSRKILKAAGDHVEKKLKQDLNETAKTIFDEMQKIQDNIDTTTDNIKNDVKQTIQKNFDDVKHTVKSSVDKASKDIAKQDFGVGNIKEEISEIGLRVIGIGAGLALAVVVVVVVIKKRK